MSRTGAASCGLIKFNPFLRTRIWSLASGHAQPLFAWSPALKAQHGTTAVDGDGYEDVHRFSLRSCLPRLAPFYISNVTWEYQYQCIPVPYQTYFGVMFSWFSLAILIISPFLLSSWLKLTAMCRRNRWRGLQRWSLMSRMLSHTWSPKNLELGISWSEWLRSIQMSEFWWILAFLSTGSNHTAGLARLVATGCQAASSGHFREEIVMASGGAWTGKGKSRGQRMADGTGSTGWQ